MHEVTKFAPPVPTERVHVDDIDSARVAAMPMMKMQMNARIGTLLGVGLILLAGGYQTWRARRSLAPPSPASAKKKSKRSKGQRWGRKGRKETLLTEILSETKSCPKNNPFVASTQLQNTGHINGRFIKAIGPERLPCIKE